MNRRYPAGGAWSRLAQDDGLDLLRRVESAAPGVIWPQVVHRTFVGPDDGGVEGAEAPGERRAPQRGMQELGSKVLRRGTWLQQLQEPVAPPRLRRDLAWSG
jgi:hypothetical protein